MSDSKLQKEGTLTHVLSHIKHNYTVVETSQELLLQG